FILHVLSTFDNDIGFDYVGFLGGIPFIPIDIVGFLPLAIIDGNSPIAVPVVVLFSVIGALGCGVIYSSIIHRIRNRAFVRNGWLAFFELGMALTIAFYVVTIFLIVFYFPRHGTVPEPMDRYPDEVLTAFEVRQPHLLYLLTDPILEFALTRPRWTYYDHLLLFAPCGFTLSLVLDLMRRIRLWKYSKSSSGASDS
ncbi:MAG: hypothetical protein NTU83_03665, partial [Candidatus Hydrogenedentes bacterium]|nr:hypothetical protein [Candidatus Hydrogenedentota bacterium]